VTSAGAAGRAALFLRDIGGAGPEEPQAVSYSYWPVHYLNGDPTVISNVPMPLSGVQFSVLMRGVGEMRAALQLAEPEVRAMYPWDKFIPRKTGVVAVRTVTREDGYREHTIPFGGVLWQAPVDPETGRMNMTFQTVESLWARRLITGPPPLGQRDSAGNLRPGVSWVQTDQFQIARDLLNPALWSQLGTIGGQYPAWINVEGPSGNSGVSRDMSYKRGVETSLLTAHQDRSRVINGYEWYTTHRVLAGNDAYSAGSFRVQFVAGYPRLGRRYASGDSVPTFTYRTDGRGNVTKLQPAYNSQNVSNVVWGTGSGFDDDALRVVSKYPSDWGYGFLMTEARYSNQDVSVQDTLQDQTNARLIQSYANEQYMESLTVRGDLFPYFDTYAIGDDCLVDTDDWTWPDRSDGSRGAVYVSRIMGYRVTPPEGDQSETVELVLAGQDEVS
jgi:hypothetical protein